MRLQRIEIKDFQCIEKAELELGPGLNVLYGPNDHGKSSLASAIRSALLLQHTSSAAERLQSWHSGAQRWCVYPLPKKIDGIGGCVKSSGGAALRC